MIELPTIVQIIATGAVTYLVNDARQSLRDIRTDLKSQQDRQAAYELALASHKARCDERHRGDR